MKILKSSDKVQSSDDLQNLLIHSHATTISKIDPDLLSFLGEINIFDEVFSKYFQSIYSDKVKLFKENLIEMDPEDQGTQPGISSVMVLNETHSLLLLIKLTKHDTIEDIYLIKLNGDPTSLTGAETDFLASFKKDLLKYVWRYNIIA
mmetsp:Transcript_16958/g.14852  ORF Transcript_16958/g.14852 Transcript_16958/m.14852 type:complete len:148 (-) Transcript_16958:106-549(-)